MAIKLSTITARGHWKNMDDAISQSQRLKLENIIMVWILFNSIKQMSRYKFITPSYLNQNRCKSPGLSTLHRFVTLYVQCKLTLTAAIFRIWEWFSNSWWIDDLVLSFYLQLRISLHLTRVFTGADKCLMLLNAFFSR